MTKFKVKFLREFEVDIDAESLEIAGQLAQKVLTQFANGTCKLLSIVQEGVVVTQESEKPRTPPRGGPPNLGGSPGTPVIRTPEIVDQIARAA